MIFLINVGLLLIFLIFLHCIYIAVYYGKSSIRRVNIKYSFGVHVRGLNMCDRVCTLLPPPLKNKQTLLN